MKKVVKEVWELEPHEETIYQVETSYCTIRKYMFSHFDGCDYVYSDDYNDEFTEYISCDENGNLKLNKFQFFNKKDAEEFYENYKADEKKRLSEKQEKKEKEQLILLKAKYENGVSNE